MKHRKVNYMTFVIAGALFACSAISEDKPATADSKTSKEDMMKKVEAAATPGPAHKALESLAGDWNAEGKCWASPDGSPTTSKGVSKVHWVLGGRFLQEDFSGEYMGKSFRGMGLTGYDNLKKKYVSSWVDDMSTGLFTTEGTADAAGKVLPFEGRWMTRSLAKLISQSNWLSMSSTRTDILSRYTTSPKVKRARSWR